MVMQQDLEARTTLSQKIWQKPREPKRRRGKETTSVRSSQGANIKSKILDHNLQFV